MQSVLLGCGCADLPGDLLAGLAAADHEPAVVHIDLLLDVQVHRRTDRPEDKTAIHVAQHHCSRCVTLTGWRQGHGVFVLLTSSVHAVSGGHQTVVHRCCVSRGLRAVALLTYVSWYEKWQCLLMSGLNHAGK